MLQKNKMLVVGLLLVSVHCYARNFSETAKILNVRYNLPARKVENLGMCITEVAMDPNCQALPEEDRIAIIDVVSAHYNPAKSPKSVSVLTEKVSEKCHFRNDAAFKKMHDACMELRKCKAFKHLSVEQKRDAQDTIKASASTLCANIEAKMKSGR